MKQIEAEIMDRTYILACPEGAEAELNEAVRRVDEAMRKIRDAGKVRARDRIAVLAALNLAFERIQTPPAPAPSEAVPASATEDATALQALAQRLDDVLAAPAHADFEPPCTEPRTA